MTKQKAGRLFGFVQEGDIDEAHWVEFKREPDLNAAVRAEHVFDSSSGLAERRRRDRGLDEVL